MRTKYDINKLYFRFDKDENIIQSFCKIIEESYENDLGLKGFKQNYLDVIYNNYAHPIIVMYENKVIAGAILYVQKVANGSKLPLEIDTKLDLKQEFSTNDMGENYSELSRIVVSPEFRDRRVSLEIIRFAVGKSHAFNCNYLYSTAYKSQTRNTRIILSRMGIIFKTMLNVKLPNTEIYGENEMFLSITNSKEIDTEKFIKDSLYKDLIQKILSMRKPDKEKEDFIHEIGKLEQSRVVGAR
jgi:hypothetical protein